jgi:formamidopyrimidine-DNA glycosylase
MNQREQVLHHLKMHGSITSWKAITEYHITRLSAVIFDLKDDGHDISSKMMTSNGRKFAEYTLHQKAQTSMFGRPEKWECDS